MHPTTTKERLPLDAEFEDFLLERKARRVAKTTIQRYQHALNKWRAYCVAHGVIKTVEVTPRTLRGFVVDLEEKGHNEGGVSHLFRAVKSFLLWYEDEYEPPNWKSPTRKVKVRVPKPPLLEPLSLEHFVAMANTCEFGQFTGYRDMAILCTLLDTGIRHQELTDLAVSDIDLASGKVLIHCGKGGKSRVVFVGDTARQALESYLRLRNGPELDALWLTDEGTTLTKSGIRQVIERRAKQAGIPRSGPHAFRRAFAINSLRNGMDVVTLRRLMGHSTLEVTTRYLKFVTNDLQAAHAKYGVVDHL